jgi:hypothetical protein
MHKLKIKNVYLGINDGKKEALYKNDFENYFFDYNNMYEQATSKEIFLILGKKGSGKTLLAEYIKKISRPDPQWFCEVRSYKEFKFHELVQLKTNDISPNEYISIWEWVSLIDLARLCLKDERITNSKDKQKLKKFFDDNYYSIDIDTEKIIEKAKTGKIKGQAFGIGGEGSISEKKEVADYIYYLEDLRTTVIALLSNSKSRYDLYYDELDDRFKNDLYYKDGIISLIKAVDKLNLLIIEAGANAKLSLLLRSDIFHILNDPDLNKIRMVNALYIDWGNIVESNSPLFELVTTKAKASSKLLENLTNDEVFKLFPQDIKGISPERYILERTLFRPRDLVSMLNLIIKKYPDSSYFGWKGFDETRKDYSEYFLQEIRNELSGHVDDIFIDESIRFLKQFNRHRFEFVEIQSFLSENAKRYQSLDIHSLLNTLFKFNIIGNCWFNEQKKKNFYCWSYRDPKADIDYKKSFVVHLGLREAISK